MDAHAFANLRRFPAKSRRSLWRNSRATEPGAMVRQLEAKMALPTGTGERFAGYGIMGLPFASGHVLALRRFPASSIGPGYTSVWHRDPAGTWIFYADVDPHRSCSSFSAPRSPDRNAAPSL